jgi:very-short-patch-repair endonuclease
MRPEVRSVEHQVARIAGRQHGVVTQGQLLEAGLSGGGVKRRVAKGRLHRVHRGVYRVGHRAPSTEAWYMASVLACGEKAVLSGRAAAFLFGLTKGKAPAPEVTAVADRRVAGVLTRRVRHLDGREVALYRGIPITSVPRTVVDLAGCLSLDALAGACHEAEVRHRINALAVDAVLARRPNAPGAGKLKEIFHGEVRVTLSELERRFLLLLQSNRVPLPETNRRVDGIYVDCRWPEYRLTVELDSYRYHHTRHAWEQDRRRDRQARARGDELRRYTYRDVTEDQAPMLAELRALLSR